MIWALVALSLGELCLVHLLVAVLWSPLVALALSLVTIAGIIWLVCAIRSFTALPVLVDDDRVVLRAGRIKGISIGRDQIARLRTDITAEEAKRRDVLKLSLLAHPNVILDLVAPIDMGRKRAIRTVAHRLDDPVAFAAALADRTRPPKMPDNKE